MNDPTRWVYEENKRRPDRYSVDRHERERIEQGFSEYDWWNFNSYLNWVLIKALERFKAGAGHPVYGEVQTMDDWRAVLDKMIAGFKAQERITNDFDRDTYEQDQAVFEEGMRLFTQYYASLWD